MKLFHEWGEVRALIFAREGNQNNSLGNDWNEFVFVTNHMSYEVRRYVVRSTPSTSYSLSMYSRRVPVRRASSSRPFLHKNSRQEAY